MNSNRPIEADGDPAGTANQPVGSHRLRYIESAPVPAVMFDQLDYLLAHAGENCAPGCEDCVRLYQVKNWLLLPFRSNRVRSRARR